MDSSLSGRMMADRVDADFARGLEREINKLADLRDEAVANNIGLANELRELERHRLEPSIQNQRLRAELNNIANAKPSEWGDMSDQFQAWAQNRARHALSDLPNVV